MSSPTPPLGIHFMHKRAQFPADVSDQGCASWCPQDLLRVLLFLFSHQGTHLLTIDCRKVRIWCPKSFW